MIVPATEMVCKIDVLAVKSHPYDEMSFVKEI